MNNGIPGKSIAVLLVLFLAVSFAAASTTVPAQLTFRKVRNSINCVPVLRNGNYLYTAGWKGFAVYDLKNPLEPELILRFPEISGRQMALSGGTLYITAREKGLWILDVSAPEKPVLLTRFDTVELATGIAVTGNIVFVAQRIYGVFRPGKAAPYRIDPGRGNPVGCVSQQSSLWRKLGTRAYTHLECRGPEPAERSRAYSSRRLWRRHGYFGQSLLCGDRDARENRSGGNKEKQGAWTRNL